MRIAILGPESSGKSGLCTQLASHFNAPWIAEYAREYLEKNGSNYNLEIIEHIYRVQFESEMKWIENGKKIIFTDTEFIIGKVWCEHVYKKCPLYFDTMIRRYPYDLYLLTAPDLPWQPDPLRENPGKGKFFFDWYERILIEQKLNYRVVMGAGDERFRNALAKCSKVI